MHNVQKIQKHNKNTDDTHSAKIQQNTLKNTTNFNALEAQIEMLQKQIEHERQDRERERHEAKDRERKADERENQLQNRIDKLTDTISKQTILISDMRFKAEKQPVEQRKGFFAWLIGSRS